MAGKKLKRTGSVSFDSSLKDDKSDTSSQYSGATTNVAFSDYNYPLTKQNPEEGAMLLRVRGKPGIEWKNLFVIPSLTFLVMLTGVDVMQSSTQLLSDPESYNFPKERAAEINTNSMTYASIVSILVLLFGGIIYDLLGRKATVVIMLLTMAFSTAPFPFGKLLPDYQVLYFMIFKIVYSCSFIPLIMNPFINDYVKVQDRGLAMGLQNTGLVCGTITSVAGLFTLTSLVPAAYGFIFLALL